MQNNVTENDKIKDIRLFPYFWWLQLFWLYRVARKKWEHLWKTCMF